MNIKAFIFGKKNNQARTGFGASTNNANTTSAQNPYVKGAEGRKEWNDRYLNQKDEIRHWRIAFFASASVCVVLALVIAKIASESRVQPFVVETNQGMPFAIKTVQDASPKDQLIINYAINQFIINAKSIVADPQTEKLLLNKVYAYAADNTLGYLKDYYEKNNPILLAAQYTVSVKIINSMPINKNTWQVVWDEVKRSAVSGEIIGTTRWMADLTYKFGQVNQNFMEENPFGLYITAVTWSQSQA